MPANRTEFEKRLWEATGELHANSKLKSPEYSASIFGLIFLRYADIILFRLLKQPLQVNRTEKESPTA